MGFFDLGPVNIERGDEKEHKPRRHDCQSCGLFLECRTPKTTYTGQGKKGILILGGAVTSYEDRNENQSHGTTYNFLKKELEKQGIDIKRDCFYTHAVKCYSKGDRESKDFSNPTKSACSLMLHRELEELQPAIIIVTNQLAWDVLLYERKTGRASYASHYDWAGLTIPDQELMMWVCPIFDPEWVMDCDSERTPNKYRPLWDNHLEQIINLVGQKVPKFEIESRLQLAYTEEEAVVLVNKAMEWKEFAFDYETTGLKPHREGHDILAMSISNGDVAYGFLMYESSQFRSLICRLLQNPAVKIAHNGSFERSWSSIILNTAPCNLAHDPMVLWHCLHNTKPTGLKFLTYAFYGVLGYDSSIDQYIKASREEEAQYGANSFNNMRNAPWRPMIKYCTMDSLFTAWLRFDLLPRLHPRYQLPGYLFFMDAMEELDIASQNGMRLDLSVITQRKPELERRASELYTQIMNADLITKNWDKDRAFNPKSDAHVRHLLYNSLGMTPTAFTEGDNPLPSVDEDTLLTFSNRFPFLLDLLEYRGINKVLSTYLGQFLVENCDGIVHSFFHLHKVKTFRPSTSSVNLANQPKRDKETKKLIRTAIVPKRGHRLVEYDFKGAEVAIAAHVTGDRNLIKYVSDLSTDMHRDLACGLFFIKPEQVNKALRGNAVKGPWTFAQFYGSWHKQCARGVWDEIDIPNSEEIYGFNVVSHLKENGIMSYSDWEAHCEAQERVLWDEFFPDYKKWRERTYKSFVKNGYVNYENGFRYEGPATKNEVLNAPVQGFSFHTLMWAMRQSGKEFRKLELNSEFICQIYDAMVLDIDPAEEGIVDKIIWEFATQKVREHWDISVPLMVEKERSEIDGNWSAMTGCGYLGGYL